MDNGVFLLTSSRCVYCGPMKRRLKSLGVEFEEIRVDTKKGEKLISELGRAAGQGLPMLVIKESGKIVSTNVGLLSHDKIKKTLGVARIARSLKKK